MRQNLDASPRTPGRRLAHESSSALPCAAEPHSRGHPLFVFALLVVVLISTPFPAQSAFVHFGIADPHTALTVSHYDLLRSGQLRQFNLSESQGLASLPSFHVMLLLAYAVRMCVTCFPSRSC
nr:phosphatase PAP2 family protein [Burkholderia pyrrocinia]